MPGQSCQMPRRSLDCCLICLLAMWCAPAQLMTSERSLARFTDHLTMILRLLVTLMPVQLCYLPPLSTQDHGEQIAVFYYFNRDLQILRQVRLRERDFLNTQCEPTSFWRENAIADRDVILTLLRVLARMSQCRKQVIKCQKFYHFAICRGHNLL